MASPLDTVKKQFGSKEDLVSRLAPMLDRSAEESEAQFKERLLRVSNRKLLTLWEREQLVREKFKSREGLADVVAKLHGNGKADADYRRKALTLSTGRLLSAHRTLARRAPKA